MCFTLFSCEVVVESDRLEARGGKLVVNSLIGPQSDLIIVEVSLSKSILGYQTDYYDNFEDIVTSAVVSLSDGASSVFLTYDPTLKKYFIDSSLFPIATGNTYYLKVEYLGITATAYCKIPEAVTDFWVEEEYNGYESNINVYWKDAPSVDNFYYVIANSEGLNNSVYYFYGDRLTSDLNKDGFTISAEGTAYIGESGARNVNIEVISLDENYYEYETRLANNSGDDPFSEPIPRYSNVNGGVGIFAGFNVAEGTFIFN